jgi:hypothetical protein
MNQPITPSGNARPDNDHVGVVYNACWGGFSLSDAALALYARFKGMYLDEVDGYDLVRHDQKLVSVVLEMGADANGNSAELRIKWIPRNTFYRISEHDGMESVILASEQHWIKAGDE